jgi:hypothetical protein
MKSHGLWLNGSNKEKRLKDTKKYKAYFITYTHQEKKEEKGWKYVMNRRAHGEW